MPPVAPFRAAYSSSVITRPPAASRRRTAFLRSGLIVRSTSGPVSAPSASRSVSHPLRRRARTGSPSKRRRSPSARSSTAPTIASANAHDCADACDRRAHVSILVTRRQRASASRERRAADGDDPEADRMPGHVVEHPGVDQVQEEQRADAERGDDIGARNRARPSRSGPRAGGPGAPRGWRPYPPARARCRRRRAAGSRALSSARRARATAAARARARARRRTAGRARSSSTTSAQLGRRPARRARATASSQAGGIESPARAPLDSIRATSGSWADERFAGVLAPAVDPARGTRDAAEHGATRARSAAEEQAQRRCTRATAARRSSANSTRGHVLDARRHDASAARRPSPERVQPRRSAAALAGARPRAAASLGGGVALAARAPLARARDPAGEHRAGQRPPARASRSAPISAEPRRRSLRRLGELRAGPSSAGELSRRRTAVRQRPVLEAARSRGGRARSGR